MRDAAPHRRHGRPLSAPPGRVPVHGNRPRRIRLERRERSHGRRARGSCRPDAGPRAHARRRRGATISRARWRLRELDDGRRVASALVDRRGRARFAGAAHRRPSSADEPLQAERADRASRPPAAASRRLDRVSYPQRPLHAGAAPAEGRGAESVEPRLAHGGRGGAPARGARRRGARSARSSARRARSSARCGSRASLASSR